jgi:integrase
VDFEAGTLRSEGTVVRIPGQGLIVQPNTKTRAGMRTIQPPTWVMDALKRRFADALCEWVFPTSKLTLRDPENTRTYLRRVLAGTEWAGLHPHAFRHLVATRLDDAGLSARQIADYLGHDHIGTTQEVYMDRGIVGQGANAALTEIEPTGPNDSDG